MLSKSQARVFFLGGTGVFTAAFLALSYDSMQQMPKMTNAEKLSESVIRGKYIWEDNNCMGCHTLFGEGAYYAPELTKVVDRKGKPWMRAFLKDPSAFTKGGRQMVDYNFTDEEIEDVIAFFEWCGKVDLNGFPAKPPLGRVADPETPKSAVFKANCAACHTGAATSIGPDLSEVTKRLSKEQIEEQIRNPKNAEGGKSIMPKLPLTDAQVKELLDYLEAIGK